MDNYIDLKYKGSISEIKSMTNTLLCIGHIDEVSGDEFIKFTSKNEDFPIIDYNTVVKISVMNTKLGCLFLMGTVYMSDADMLFIKDVTVLADTEKRNFFRVKLTNCADVFNRYSGKKMADIIFVDLSLNGFMCRTQTELSCGVNYVLEIKIKKKKYLFEFAIIREKPSINNYFIYGCEFRDMDIKTQDILSSFIFDQQRRNINQVKNRY